MALAAYLATFAAELFAGAQRREVSLLPTRGAKPSLMAAIITVASFVLAVLGSLLGVVFGQLVLRVSAGSQVAWLLSPLSPMPRSQPWTREASGRFEPKKRRPYYGPGGKDD